MPALSGLSAADLADADGCHLPLLLASAALLLLQFRPIVSTRCELNVKHQTASRIGWPFSFAPPSASGGSWNRYPTDVSVKMYCGYAGSISILLRNCLMTTRRLSACSPPHGPQRTSHLPGDNRAEPARSSGITPRTTAPKQKKGSVQLPGTLLAAIPPDQPDRGRILLVTKHSLCRGQKRRLVREITSPFVAHQKVRRNIVVVS